MVVLTDQLNTDDDLSKLLLKKLTLRSTTENSAEGKTDVGYYGFASRYKNELVKLEVEFPSGKYFSFKIIPVICKILLLGELAKRY